MRFKKHKGMLFSFWRKLSLVFIMTGYVLIISAHFAGGLGTAEDPWLIKTAEHLANINHYLGADYQDNHYLQIADIDLGVSPYNEGQGWIPIGNSSNPFTGSLDGDGYTIANLTIDNYAGTELGLFGRTSEATISNLGVTDVNIIGHSNTGGLVAVARFTTINNSYVTGNFEVRFHGGILAGSFSDGLIENCFTEGTIAANNPGGIVGYLTSSTVKNSYNKAHLRITENGAAGGICSTARMSHIENSYSNGQISFPGEYGVTGGLVGIVLHYVNIINSFWNTETTGVSYSVGGGNRMTTAEMLEVTTYENWDFENVWDIGYEGQTTYPWLRYLSEPRTESFPELIPPARLNASVVEESETELTWQPPSYGNPDLYKIFKNGVLYNAVPGNINRYLDREVELFETNSYYIRAVYGEEESFRSNLVNAASVPGGYAAGRGSIEEPYEIQDAQHLDNVRYNLEAHYIQTSDIDLSGFESWRPIGGDTRYYDRSQPFSGSYDGDGYTISNLSITAWHGYYYGLFGCVGRGGSGAVLRNIILENVNIDGYKVAGGLAGIVGSDTKIDNCHSSANIHNRAGYDTSTLRTGGLVGELINSKITNSSSRGSVTGRHNTGGLVGAGSSVVIKNSYSSSAVFASDNFGDSFGGFIASISRNSVVENCYSRGPVTGSARHTGGFIGRNFHSTLLNCYSTGKVKAIDEANYVGGFSGRNHYGTIEQCYWDVNLSGIDHSAGGAGKESEQMRYPFEEDTYFAWDFDYVWNYDTDLTLNMGYPYLRWIDEDMIKDYPLTAVRPEPENESDTVTKELQAVSWIYTVDAMYRNPAGFRFYFGDEPEFNDDYIWVPKENNTDLYSVEDILPEDVDYADAFYWKVVPTTREPENRDETSNRQRRQISSRYNPSNYSVRGDARNVPLWRFSIERHPIPATAVNPVPADRATDVPLDLARLEWGFYTDPYRSDPGYFKVYLNKTGIFDEDDDFEWVWFSSYRTEFNCREALPEILKPNTTYYWKIVPTTSSPDYWRKEDREPVDTDKQARIRNLRNRQIADVISSETGHDAENVPVWSFKTGEHTHIEQKAPQLVTGLGNNYPNPFNPYTTIEYSIAEKTNVEISVYNIRGRLVKNLVSEIHSEGVYQIVWDGRDAAGREMSSGVYYYRLKTDQLSETRKMIMIR